MGWRLVLFDIQVHSDWQNAPVLHTLRAGGVSRLYSVVEMYLVNGEHRVILVVEGDAKEVPNAFSCHPTSISCVPVRPLDNFARDVLKLDESLVKFDILMPLCPANTMTNEVFFLDIEKQIGEGEILEEYLEKWKEELVLFLKKRKAGQLICSAYKVVGQHKVKAFIAVPSADDLANCLYEEPILKSMGRNVCQTATYVSLLHSNPHINTM